MGKKSAAAEVLSIDHAAEGQAASRDAILKAVMVSGERQTSRVTPNVDEIERQFVGVGAIEPPYNPWTLVTLLEHSNALRQNIDAYVTNIDAFGHRFEPIIDLEGADADARLKAYILNRRGAANPSVVADPHAQIPEPTTDELDAAKAELRERMLRERSILTQFFDYASLEMSFATLRRRTRQDIETHGNGYWEVLRDGKGNVAGFEPVPGFTVRHMPLDPVPLKVPTRIKSDEFTYSTIEVTKRFRRFVQVFEQRVVFFKEFGDPRLIGAGSGRIFRDAAEMEDAGDIAATEMLHFRIYSSKSSYGVPRWIGVLLAVLGSRQAEEVNYLYFENKGVPPLALLVSGGRVSQNSVTRIQDYIKNEIAGKKNFHKILILEAEPAMTPGSFENSGRMKLEIKPLTGAQHNDALFQNYDQANIDKVGMSFRLPRMLRGDIRDFNRATAEAALEFAEMQVFSPERDEFDFVINRKILPALGIRFWRFASKSPATKNPQDLAEMIGNLTEKGVLVPAEARELVQEVFNRELRKIDAPWVKQPIKLTEAGIAPPSELAAPGMMKPSEAAYGQSGAPLGGAAINTADAPPGLPGATQEAPAGREGGSTLTGTDRSIITTVNEARADEGRGPLQRMVNGAMEDDPDGWLTVAEFKAKRVARGESLGAAQGEAQGGTAPGATETKGDLSTGNLASDGGLNRGGQRRRYSQSEDLEDLAYKLLQLRKAMAEVEAEEVREKVRRAVRAEAELESEA